MSFFYQKLQNLFFDVKYRNNRSEYARKLGVRVGERCKIHNNPRECFGSEPWLVSIGNHVLVATGVKFITHDGGTFLFIDEYPKTNVLGPIYVRDNVYIGMNAMILPNVTIEDNVIVAAGAVVTKDLESGWVYGGVPARKIKTVEEYRRKALRDTVDTNGMSIQEKKRHLQKIRPEWFE